MDSETLIKAINESSTKALDIATSTETYTQIGIIAAIYLFAYWSANRIRTLIPLLNSPTPPGESYPLRRLTYRCGKLLYPILALILLKLSVEFSQSMLNDGWAIQFALAVAMLLLYNSFVALFIQNTTVARVFLWIGMPIIFFNVIGVLDDIVRVMESMSVEIGNIKLSAYGIVRVLIFGSLLFWLGRISNSTGQTIIRKQETLDLRTREVFAKLFEIVLFFGICLLLLQLLGVDLTALAVFGGALGVGLGFGLQAIASNFISGVIILLDRSVSLGDYIELEDGRTGLVTEMNMRSTTLETFDGKDIVVPNEKFITSSFTNWTHKDAKQRYRVDFSVSYKTDIRSMVELVKTAVSNHPQVLSGADLPFEERPDCEIDSFGDSGVNMFVEFWMQGVDDGKNRVGGDLLLIIFETLKENGIEIPYPQRDVHLVSTPNPGTRVTAMMSEEV